MTRRWAPAGKRWAHALFLLAGGALVGAALTALRLPAGTLIGAVLGSALVNRFHRRPAGEQELPAPVRVVGQVLLGCVAGARLDSDTLVTLAHIALPLAASILALILLDLCLATLLVRRYEVDPLTAVLACAPGGVSEIAITASQQGAEVGIVLAIHTVRVLAVVLLVLPVLVVWLGPA